MIFNPIMTGGGGALPELTNPAERDEVVEGKEYIDKDGNKKVGNVYYPDIDYPVYLKPYEMDVTNGILTCRADVEVRTFLRPGHDIQIKYGDAGIDEGDASYLGDATPGDVSSNVKFSSIEGIKLKGSLVDGRGALARIPLDHDTTTVDTEPPWDPTIVKLYGTPQNEMIVGPNSKLYIEVEGSYFGNAMPSDVRSGKTFTGANGKDVGTMEAGFTTTTFNNMVQVNGQVRPSINCGIKTFLCIITGTLNGNYTIGYFKCVDGVIKENYCTTICNVTLALYENRIELSPQGNMNFHSVAIIGLN